MRMPLPANILVIFVFCHHQVIILVRMRCTDFRVLETKSARLRVQVSVWRGAERFDAGGGDRCLSSFYSEAQLESRQRDIFSRCQLP